MTVTYADAGDRALVALADEFAAALAASGATFTIVIDLATSGSSTFLALRVDGPDESIIIGSMSDEWVAIFSADGAEEGLVRVDGGLDDLVDLTVERITTGVPV